MTTARRSLRHDEDGSILAASLVLFAGVAVVVITLIGAQEGWAVRRDARLAADAAARAAAYVDPIEWRQAQNPSPSAAARAHAVLADAGYTGSVSISGRTVTVTVVAPVRHTIPMPGLPSQVQATSTVQLVRGVDGTEERNP